jgi:excisionase family DNA binding protein
MTARRNGFRYPDQLLLPWSPRYTVSAQHVARMLDVSVRTVYRMVESGEILAYKVRQGKTSSPLRINYDSVISHIEKMHAENGLEKRF